MGFGLFIRILVLLVFVAQLPACGTNEARQQRSFEHESWSDLSTAPQTLQQYIARSMRGSGSGEGESTCPHGNDPARWSLTASYTGQWRRLSEDTLELRLALRVVGDVEVRDGGYRSYFVTERVATDSAALMAIEEADTGWTFSCSPSRSYIAIATLSDSGMYINESLFGRLRRIADSIQSVTPSGSTRR
jgi:hypothetical protein